MEAVPATAAAWIASFPVSAAQTHFDRAATSHFPVGSHSHDHNSSLPYPTWTRREQSVSNASRKHDVVGAFMVSTACRLLAKRKFSSSAENLGVCLSLAEVLTAASRTYASEPHGVLTAGLSSLLSRSHGCECDVLDILSLST